MISVGLFLSVACVTQQKSTWRNSDSVRRALRLPAAEYTGGYDYDSFVDRSPQATITCKEFFDLLNNSRPKPDTVKAALQLLKRNKPKYFSHYTLIPQSLSLHGSSWSNPRALVYGGDGKMVVTFNGDPRQEGYEQLEVMCFHPSDSTFVFREITFPREAKSDLDQLTPQQKQQPFVISPANGYAGTTHDCRQCHQTPARPNWDTYANWPSAYGAIDDSMFRTEFRKQFLNPGSFDQKYTDAEIAALQTFSRTGRYSVLQANATDRPNLAAGKLFGTLNGQRIVAELKRLGPKFERVKKSFAQALYCPVQGLEYKTFEAKRGNGGYSTVFDALVAPVDPDVMRVVSASARYYRSKADRTNGNFKLDKSFNDDDRNDLNEIISAYYRSLGFSNEDAPYIGGGSEEAIRLANLEKIVKPLGIEIQNWSLIVNGGYEFEDGSSGDRGPSFGQILDKPFLDTFFADDVTLIDLVHKRREAGDYIKERKDIAQQEKAICDHLMQ